MSKFIHFCTFTIKYKLQLEQQKKKKKGNLIKMTDVSSFFPKLIIAINILEAKKGTTSSRVIIYIKQGRPAWEGEVLS